MKPNDVVRLNGVGRLYTLIEISTHNAKTDYECQWAVLKPPAPATHFAHWPVELIEPVIA